MGSPWWLGAIRWMAASSCLVAACGGQATKNRANGEEPVVPDEASGGAAAGRRECGNWYDAEGACASGERCTGSTTCGTTWYCEREYPQCSAAAPFLACGCDGRVVSIAAGCPSDRYAWSFDSSGYIESGQACDAAATGFRLDSIVIRASGFEGTSSLRLYRRDWNQILELPIVGGGVEVVLEDGPYDPREFSLQAFADVNGDGMCSESIDLTGVFPPTTVDAVSFRLEFELEPGNLSARCVGTRW